MNVHEFEATYREMSDLQLMELTAQLEDLLPDARTALAAELHRRGKKPADIETYLADRKAEEPGEDGNHGGETPAGSPSYLREGPIPADWVTIPSFAYQEAPGLAACMKTACIPYQLNTVDIGGRGQYVLAVPRDKFPDCIAALKEHYELLDEAPDPFTGDCPACGAKLEKAQSCTDCGLSFSQDGWDAMSRHPFVKFLEQRGLGKRRA